MSAGRLRIDQLLVERGLAESRERAQALVIAGYVLVDGQKARKPGQAVKRDSCVELIERLPFVGRGGLKLKGALDGFGIDVAGKVCVDIGSSTGGFTDCLLQRGAARVYAVDVGAGQLDWKLRNDPRVVVKESVNARYLTPGDIGEPADLVTCDVSFISVTMILPALVRLLKPAGIMIVLVKPQFEAGRRQVGKGGIVKDPALHASVCARIEAAVRGYGFQTAIMDSPILGAEGNREFLLYASH
ncbi:MAG: TlyA family RNA methyltransferase [Acidobacteria bacterium]|nr:TlyA family RNA methyltransferase [Acidobacteriota bacterium]